MGPITLSHDGWSSRALQDRLHSPPAQKDNSRASQAIRLAPLCVIRLQPLFDQSDIFNKLEVVPVKCVLVAILR